MRTFYIDDERHEFPEDRVSGIVVRRMSKLGERDHVFRDGERVMGFATFDLTGAEPVQFWVARFAGLNPDGVAWDYAYRGHKARA